MSKTLSSKLPAATLAQRIASLSETQLMDLAAVLARDVNADAACTAVLEALETCTGNSPAFQDFVTEIYA